MYYIRNGWSLVKNQFPSVIILFLYQLLWGLFLYRIVDHALTALLLRYPDPPPNQITRVLFLLEGQLGLLHNREFRLFMALFLGMVLLRFLLTPFIRAGILYGLQPGESNQTPLTFFQGIRAFWKPVSIFYLLETVLVAAPLCLIAPKILGVLPQIMHSGWNASTMLPVVLYVLGWICYAWLVRQIILFAQFGYLFKTGLWSSLALCIRTLVSGILISLLLSSFIFITWALLGTVSWVWTGLLALILQQTYPFFRSLFKIWSVTSQFRLWESKSQKS